MNLTQQADGYHSQLLNSDDATRWHLNRGIDVPAMRHFKLGYIETPLTKEHAGYRGWYTIPYLTTTGKVIQIKARRPADGRPKYMKIGEDFPLDEPKAHLFNAMAAMPTLHRDDVFLIEGEYDAIIAWQAGFKAVGSPGANAWHEPWTYLFEAATVAAVYDNDGLKKRPDCPRVMCENGCVGHNAGEDGARVLEQIFMRHHIELGRRQLPEGQDLTDLWLTGGRELVRSVLTR